MTADPTVLRRALIDYIAPRVPTSTHLRIIVARSDFEAYRVRGRSITGTVWRKSPEFAYPDGMSEREWYWQTVRAWRRAQPWPARLAGDLIALYALARAIW